MNLPTAPIELKAFRRLDRKFSEFNDKHGWAACVVAPCIVAVMLLVIYAVKHVYPFGNNTVVYYDLANNFLPIYTYFWDVMHGDAGLYLNWYSGLGVSMADITGTFLLFPTNLLLLLSSRDGLLYFMSYFLIIKMALSALTISLYYKKRFGSSVGAVCAGLLYACSGYVLQDYTNIFFLDLVIIFPLLVWAFERLINEHKYVLFTGLLFITFLGYSQLVISVMFYLVFKCYFLLETVPDEKKGKSLRLFFFSVLTAFLLSCFNTVPMVLQLMLSTRIEMNQGFDYIKK
nr:YfhO family protein [Lachnospiraceae bacterium]